MIALYVFLDRIEKTIDHYKLSSIDRISSLGPILSVIGYQA